MLLLLLLLPLTSSRVDEPRPNTPLGRYVPMPAPPGVDGVAPGVRHPSTWLMVSVIGTPTPVEVSCLSVGGDGRGLSWSNGGGSA